MKRYWSGLFVASALAATASLGAQAQNPANTPPTDSAAQPGTQRTPAPPSAQTRATENTVTVTGCVANAPTASASGAGSATAGQGNRDQAVPGQSAPGEGRTAPGSTAGAGATANTRAAQRFVLNNARMASTGDAGRSAVGTTGTGMTTYQLEGGTADVSAHVNHRVEVTGTLQNSPAAATGGANAAGSTAVGPTLRVTSVRMLSMNCDEAKTPGTTGSTPGATGTSPTGGARPSGGNPSGVPAEPRPRDDAPAPRPQP